MKNTLELELQTTQTKITFCYGKKAYEKYMIKNHYPNGYIEMDAVTSIVTNRYTNDFNIVIGCLKKDNVYTLKGLVVHELSHSITEWMEYYGFKCDELRSYTLQYLYQEIMPFLDEILLKKATR